MIKYIAIIVLIGLPIILSGQSPIFTQSSRPATELMQADQSQLLESAEDMEGFGPYISMLNELSNRRRLNVNFQNEQSLLYGAQMGSVNTTRGNLTFLRRDLVTVGRIPLVLGRVYDSSLPKHVDFGAGWRLTAAETITPSITGDYIYHDESASKIHLVWRADGELHPSPPMVTDLSSVKSNQPDQLLIELRNGLRKQFQLIDGLYRLTQVSDRNDNIIELEYIDGLLVGLYGDNDRSISIKRNAAGRVVSAIDEQGRQLTYRYDARGRLQASIGPDGLPWRYRYDNADRLIEEQHPDSGISRMVDYNDSGRVIYSATPSASYTFRYAGQTTIVTTDSQQHNIFRFNRDGITTTIKNALGVSSSVDLDEHNRVISITRDSKTQAVISYDKRGNIAQVEHPLENSLQINSYNDQNRLISIQILMAGNHRSNAEIKQLLVLDYDAHGNVLSRKHNKGSSSMTYNALGDLITLTYADASNFIFDYDNDGQIIALADQSDQRVSFDYHADGKLATTYLTNGDAHSYDYNALGQRVRTVFNRGELVLGTVDYEYTTTGSISLTRTENADGVIGGNFMTLDDQQRVVSIEYFGGRRFEFEYDSNGNVTVSRAADEYGQENIIFDYDQLNRINRITTVAGQTLTYQYAKGEPDLRLQHDAKTASLETARTSAAATFASSNDVFLQRSRRSLLGVVALDPSALEFRLTADMSPTADDDVMSATLQRSRLLGLLSTDLDGMEFEQPSNIRFWPAEYRSLNCCFACRLIYGVICFCDDLPTDPSDPNGNEPCSNCVPVLPPPLQVEITGPSSIPVGSFAQQLNVQSSPLGGTLSNWRFTDGCTECGSIHSSGGIVEAFAAGTVKVKVDFTNGGTTLSSPEFEIEFTNAPQYVKFNWDSSVDAALSTHFSSSSVINGIKASVEGKVIHEITVNGGNVVNGVQPGFHTTFLNLSNSTGNPSCPIDLLNIARRTTCNIRLGNLGLADSSDPVSTTTINERSDANSVSNAVTLLTAHELGHALGLVPRQSELQSDLGQHLNVDNIGLNGTSTHHNTNTGGIMFNNSDTGNKSTWDGTKTFTSNELLYLRRILP